MLASVSTSSLHSPRPIIRWVQNRYNNLVKQWHEPQVPAYSMMDTQYETRSKELPVILKMFYRTVTIVR